MSHYYKIIRQASIDIEGKRKKKVPLKVIYRHCLLRYGLGPSAVNRIIEALEDLEDN